MYKNKISSILNNDNINKNSTIEEDFIVPQNTTKVKHITINCNNSNNNSPNLSPKLPPSINNQSLSPLGFLANQAVLFDYQQHTQPKQSNQNNINININKNDNLKLKLTDKNVNNNSNNNSSPILIESPKTSPRIQSLLNESDTDPKDIYLNNDNNVKNDNSNSIYNTYQHLNIPTTLSSKSNETIHYKYSKYRKESYQFEQIPLFIACFHNNINSLKTMIKFGTDMNYQCKNKGWTPLMLACQEGNLEIINLILNVKNVDINVRNFSGDTALMISCYNSRKEIIERLLEVNADSNISNNDGISPLMISSAIGDLEIMSILIKYNANVNNVDNRGYPALMYSQLYASKVNLNGNNSNITDVDNRILSINILLSAGSRIDHVSKDEFDPLKISIKHGPFNFVVYLLEHLIDVSVLFLLDSQGWSPLKLAMRYSSFPVLLLVFKKIHSFVITQPSVHHNTLSNNSTQSFILNQYHPKQLSQNSSQITITNRYQFLFECLVFLIQCQRDIDIFIKTVEYFFQIYQFRLDLAQIEILIDHCRDVSNKSIEDYLVLQHQHQYQFFQQSSPPLPTYQYNTTTTNYNTFSQYHHSPSHSNNNNYYHHHQPTQQKLQHILL